MRRRSLLSSVVLLFSVVPIVSGVVVAAPATAGPAASTATGTALRCGATLTGQVVLTHDLTCTGNGPTLTGDADVDLRGHRLTGPGTAGSAVGLTVVGTGTVRVRNGVLRQWNAAVAGRADDLRGDDDPTPGTLTLDRVLFSGNHSGVSAGGELGTRSRYRPVRVDRARFAHNAVGIFATGAPVVVTGSVFTDGGQGVIGSQAEVEVTDSTLRRHTMALGCDESPCTFTRNRLSDNRIAIQGYSWTSNTVTGNTFVHNTLAFTHLFFDFSTLTGNRFVRNTTAVSVGQGSNVTLNRNRFTGNGTGVTQTATSDPDLDSTHLSLTGNRLTGNGDAISLDVDVDLADNAAVDNTGWGIRAPRATDRGGNTARGNGSSPQCVGVVCD